MAESTASSVTKNRIKTNYLHQMMLQQMVVAQAIIILPPQPPPQQLLLVLYKVTMVIQQIV